MGLACKECRYLVENEGEYQCCYEAAGEPGDYLIRDIVAQLLLCLEKGQPSISLDELLALLKEL